MWVLFLVFGFIMTELEHPVFLSRFPPDLMNMLTAMPKWALAARGVGICLGPVAIFLLVKRSRHSFWLFLMILSALAVGTLGEQWMGLPATMKSTGIFASKWMNWGLLIGMVAYTHKMQEKGVLH